MANRELLALSKLNEFAEWGASKGYRQEACKGDYEVLRLRKEGEPPVIFFTRLFTLAGGKPQHATAQSAGARLVRQWIRERKESNAKL